MSSRSEPSPPGVRRLTVALVRTWTWRQWLLGIIYLLLAVVLIGCMFGFIKHSLPASVASRITHNSEGYVIALIVIPWIQFVRGRLAGQRREWPVTVAVGLVSVLIGILLILSHLPSAIRTLNEGFIAAGLLLPYVQLRRPLHRLLPVTVMVVAVLVAAVFNQSTEVTDLAEVWGAMVLLPLTFDFFDRGILDPAAPNRPGLRYTWLAVLVVLPIVCSVLLSHHELDGGVYAVVRYVSRCWEDFVAAALTTLCLSVVLGWTGRGDHRTAEAGESERALSAQQ